MRYILKIRVVFIAIVAFILPLACHTPAAVDSNLSRAASVDQLTDKVSNALMDENSPLVFAVNSEYIYFSYYLKYYPSTRGNCTVAELVCK